MPERRGTLQQESTWCIAWRGIFGLRATSGFRSTAFANASVEARRRA